MLTIRASQIVLLGAEADRIFEDECLVYFQRQAPELSRIVGKDGLRGVVRFGWARAQRYGFTLRGPVRLYLDVMFALGSHFDTDPQLPWAARILSSTDDEMTRAERLLQAAEEYQFDVAGPGNSYALMALERLVAMPFTSEAIPEPVDADVILRLIESIYPQKVAYVGREPLLRLAAQASTAAAKLRLSGPPGTVLVSGLMAGFGHGIFEDPLYPWVRHRLDESREGDDDERTARLAQRVRTYVSAMITRLRSDA